MPGIGIILNPHSSANRRHPERVRRLAFIVGDKGSCHTTQDVLDIEAIAKEFKERAIDILGISGGDGTIHHTISTFLAVYAARPLPSVALLRGGTMNNVANDIGVRGTPESILSNLILKYHGGAGFQTTSVHCLTVNGRHGFLFGNGLVARFIEEYIRRGEGGGLKAAWLLARGMTSCLLNSRWACELARRFDAKVTVDGTTWPFRNYVVIEAGTVQSFGLGFKPFYFARKEPGRFHVAGFSMTPRKVILHQLPIWIGRKARSENYLEASACDVTIELAEPMPYMIDGEILPPTDSLRIACGPALTMIVQ
ncbi:MAG: hypothetical protein HYV03_06630 [Deltaproteobacteria bacterium]|nr:hypothetical protein [Deltaproteobacteria bacterium]